MTYAERLTAMSLAGLANRHGQRLFIRGPFGFNADADRFWLSRLADQYGMSHREMGLDDALKEFREVVCGAAICDEQLPATETVALTLAGAFRLVPALPQMESRLKAAGIPVVLDLRGAWQDPVAAQQWVFDLVGSRMSDHLIGFLDVRNKALSVILDFAGRSLDHKLPVDLVPPAKRLREGLSLVSVWGAGRLAHSTGSAIDDPEAHGKRGHSSRPARRVQLLAVEGRQGRDLRPDNPAG